jgi:hypothetical protein
MAVDVFDMIWVTSINVVDVNPLQCGEPCGAPEDSKTLFLMVAFPFVPGDHRRSLDELNNSNAGVLGCAND